MVNLRQSGTYRARVAWPYQPFCFLAVAQEDERGPQLYFERTPQPAALAVGDFDVANVWVIGDGGSQQGLRRLTVSARRAAKLEYGRSFEPVYLRARGLDCRICFVHAHRVKLIEVGMGGTRPVLSWSGGVAR